MIEFPCEQGSEAWWQARCGRVTATGASRIVTPSGKLSASRDGYLAEILAEWALGYPVTEFEGNFATERGKALEPDAFAAFAFHADADPRTVGFVYRDESRLTGCSPDFMLVDEPGELKCPEKAGIHMIYLIRGIVPNQYHAQTQFQLWTTGAACGWFMSYFPELPPLIVRVERDAKYQAALDEHIPAFVDEMMAARERLIEMGIQPPEAA